MIGGVGQSYIATAHIPTEYTPPPPMLSHPPIPMTIERTVRREPETTEKKHNFPQSDRRTNCDNKVETLASSPGSLPGGGLLSYDVARTFLEIEGGISEVILDSAASHSIISLDFFEKLQQSADSNLKINKFPQSNTLSVQGVHGDSLLPVGYTTIRVGLDNFHNPFTVICLI